MLFMRKLFLFISLLISLLGWAQPAADNTKEEFTVIKLLPATPVKDLAMTGTCWCFSTTSLVESECMKTVKQEINLSEMFTVRNIYIEKAKNYVLRQGKAQFGEGGLGHDLIRAIATYGAVPDSVYTGLKVGQTSYNHSAMVRQLQQYLNDVLKKRPLPDNWLDGYTKILDENLGIVPSEF